MRSIVFALVLSLSLAAHAAPDKQKAKDVATQTSDKFSPPKAMNLTVNPLGLAFGAANAQLSFAMGENWALGGILGFSQYSSGSSSATGYSLGAVGNYHGNGVFRDGFMGTLNAQYFTASGNSKTASGFGIAALAGYGWFWDGGFNMNVGGGLQYLALDMASLGLSISGTLPALAFNVGYAF